MQRCPPPVTLRRRPRRRADPRLNERSPTFDAPMPQAADALRTAHFCSRSASREVTRITFFRCRAPARERPAAGAARSLNRLGVARAVAPPRPSWLAREGRAGATEQAKQNARRIAPAGLRSLR